MITEEGGNHVVKSTITMASGKVWHEAVKQPDEGGKLIPIGDTNVYNATVEVPNSHEWVYKYYSNDGKLIGTRYVKLSEDGRVHEADMRTMQDGKQVVEHEYVVKQ